MMDIRGEYWKGNTAFGLGVEGEDLLACMSMGPSISGAVKLCPTVPMDGDMLTC
jgi:hypothetical protein